MSDVTYRAATIADAPAIAALFADCFTATFGALYAPHNLAAFLARLTPEAFAAEIADPAFAFRLAEVEGTLAGFIKLGPPDLPGDTPPDTIELRQLYVLGPWQGAGIAAELTDWAFAEARKRHACHLQLSVYIDNHRAHRFYEKRGFVEVGQYRFMVGDHADDDRVMRVAL
ncbi:MAG: GNAT family N-acetyltransferase [Sphingomicrobium sp.]